MIQLVADGDIASQNHGKVELNGNLKRRLRSHVVEFILIQIF